jgi:hypothetical protein
MEIRHLSYQDIDFQKWDDCISNSSQSLIYARSVCLNHLCTSWEALVNNDYETVMPLCGKIKWNIAYLFQPAFIAQLGVFGKQSTDPDMVKAFVDKALIHYRYIQIPLNFDNPMPTAWAKNMVFRNNFVLPLHNDYETIAKQFSNSHKRNIKRAGHFFLNYEKENNFSTIIKMFSNLYSNRKLIYDKHDYKNFEILSGLLATQEQLVVRKVTDKNGQILAGIILLKDDNRLYNIMSCVTTEGRKKEANYLLFQKLIQEFCQQPLLLDFEGSDIKGIAAFYEQFGAFNQPYPFISINQLPWWIRLFKK